MTATEETLETAVVRRVRERGQVVQSADPERQDELKEPASALLEQEMTPIGTTERTTRRAVRGPMTPLATGLGLCVLGAGFFFFIPSVGMMLGIIGLAGIVWGAVTA